MAHNDYAFSINPSLLGAFLAVARVGKIAAAARVLNLSQPAVTAQIARLEAELKTNLFKRSVKGVELTADGLAFLDYALRISELIHEASHIGEDKAELTDRLLILASTTIGNHVLPQIICEFSKRYSKVSIQLEVLSTEEVIEKIHEGKAALGLVEGLSRVAHVRLEKLISDEIFVVAHPEIARRIRTSQDLKSLPLICREKGSGTRAVVEKVIAQKFKRGELSFQYSLGSTEAIKLAVQNKLGVGFLSRWSVQSELASGQLEIVQLSDLRFARVFSWVFGAGANRGINEKFVDFTKRYLVQA